jgi:hypothetical protein
MFFPEITEIWRRPPLSSGDLTRQIIRAMRAAKDPQASLLDCPWNHRTDRQSRARRVVWRLTFRLTRAADHNRRHRHHGTRVG